MKHKLDIRDKILIFIVAVVVGLFGITAKSSREVKKSSRRER